MIDELLKMQLISQEDYDLYVHFQISELGRKLLSQGMMKTFMDEPPQTDFRGERFVFNDGRRSVFKDIHGAILRVEELLREQANVREQRSEEGRGRI